MASTCFGDMEPTKDVASTSSSTTAPPSWVQDAGQQNYQLAQGVLNAGFQPYTGQLTAALDPNQQQASSLVSSTAATGNPYSPTTAADYSQYGAAPAYNYNFSSVVDPNSPLGSVQSYMDPYIAATLDPTLRQISLSGDQAQQGINANATAAGAYGDARHGVVQAQQLKDTALQSSDAVNTALSGAYNSAMTNRQADESRLLDTQQSQEAANEAQLGRVAQSGTDLTNLDASNVSRATTLAGALGQTGAAAQTTQQTADTANYNEFLRQQGFTDSQISFLTSVLSGTPTATTTTGQSDQTTSQPNNTGYQALASIAAALLL